jgi:glucose/arabinose dehydrogenase
VDWQVDGEAVGQATSAPFSFTLATLSAYTSGVHVVRARARDAAGNLSSWASARVTFGGSVNLPQGFTRTTFASGLGGLGTAMAFAPDGRLFVCQQNGALRVVKNGALLSTPFVTVTTSATGERGLLGVAFHPNFSSNGWVYVYYTTASGGTHNRISRFTASGDVAVAGSELVIADLPALSSATNHNGGALHFGNDGKLYVAVGDNADAVLAPSLSSVFGKMLRFNDDGSIPGDNVWFGSTSGLNQAIWARGLRNPFSFAFDYATGTMFINDVGQGSWEEINRGRAGADYGWPATEGTSGTGGSTGYDAPVFAYGHSSNSTLVVGFAIVGGAFYRPGTFLFPSSWAGHYFFGDYVSRWVHRLDPNNGNAVYAFARVGSALTDVQVGPDGALYVLADVGGGWGVYRYGR